MLLLAAGAFGQTADQATRALSQRGELDEIRWADPTKGAAFLVGITRALPEGLEVQRGAVKRVLPFDQIGGVKFGLTMGERQLISEAKVESIPALRVFWEARQLTVQVAGSNAGDFGLALARALRQTKAYAEAQAIAKKIAYEDNDNTRRSRALAETETLAFIQVMETAKPEEVERRAWAVTEIAEESNADLMLLVTGFLMQKEFAALKLVETENPRWMEDDEMKPIRERHYHRALDLALYPSLFHPRRAAEAAEGLWQAAQIYLHTQETARAVAVLEDLLALYADSVHTSKARELLTPLKASLESGKPVAAAKPDDKPKDTEPMGPPPPPKRYNLFED
ncbi:MAG: hypothetical protein NTV80_25590 [Verrucomicrobia bacterium]|nr:hypothetical protein [Verrucomicrobiota bacterium]